MKRADIQKWAKIAAKAPYIDLSPKPSQPLRIIDLPGVRDLERRLLIYGDSPGRREDMVALVARELFGVCDYGTQFRFSDDASDDYVEFPEYSVEHQRRVYAARMQHEAQFESGNHLTDDEAAELMAKFNFDFLDDNGRPLRCTKLMSRPAEAAAKQLMGARLPDIKQAELVQFEDMLTRERDAFLAKRRRFGAV